MERNTITSVWLEAQIDEDGIGFALISEGDGPVTVEAIDHYTFEELQDMDGEMFNLGLSGSSRELLSEQAEDANIGRMLQSDSLDEKAEHLPENPSTDELLTYMGLTDMSEVKEVADERNSYDKPNVGDVMRDTDATPSWSDTERVRIIEVTDTPANEYELDIDGLVNGATVADLNSEEPADAPIVVANYIGSNKPYAFPITRLEEVGQ